MVKSPKIRHSKQRSEPVTIDLSADEVKREEAKSASPDKDEKAAAGTGSAGAATGKAAEVTAKPAETGGRAAVAGENESFSTDKASTPKKEKSAAASSAWPSAFGREAGASKPQTPPTDKGATKDRGTTAKPPEGGRRGGGVESVAAGLAGGVVALLAGGALYLGGYLPAPSQPAAPGPDNSAIEQLETEISTLREEIATLKSTPPPEGSGELNAALAETNSRIENMAVLVEDLRGQLSRLSDSVAAGGAGDGAALEALQTRLAEIEQRVADLPAGGGDTQAITTQLAQVGEQVTSLRTTLDELSGSTQQKFTQIDEQIAALGARIDEQENDPGVALAIAASALKAAIDRGQPFTSELDTFAQLAPDAPELAALREYAATGVPTAAAIASETDAAARRIIDAARPDNANAGLFERLWASAESLITVRPIGEVEGDSVPAVVARMEAALKNGNYAGAIAEYETLPDGARAAGNEFIAKVRARQAADELVSKVLAGALRA